MFATLKLRNFHQFTMLPQYDSLKLSNFQFPRWGSGTVEYYFHTVQNRLFITTKLSIFSISSKNVDFDKISKNFQRFVLVQDWKSSSSWVFSVQISTTLHVRSIWKLRCDCNSLGIWVIGPARFAACWPLYFRMMCRISPILTSHCSKTVRWIMLYPYAAFLDQGS